MNPVLLKPSAHDTQVIVRGRPWATASARSYRGDEEGPAAGGSRVPPGPPSRFDVVVCEGRREPGGDQSAAIRPREHGPRAGRGLPVILVGDIDRGGLFASLYGTLALLSAEDQALVSGFLVNKFRGDPAVLAPGLEMFSRLTGRPFFGTLPYVGGLGLDGEDSLALDAKMGRSPPLGRDVLRGCGRAPGQDQQLHRLRRPRPRARASSSPLRRPATGILAPTSR